MSAAPTMAPPAEEPATPQLRDATLIKPWLDWRNASLEASQDARLDAERDEDYYNGTQLTSAEVTKLKKRGQPHGTFNMVRRKVDYILGAEKQTRTDPKCYPRDEVETDGAEFWTDALRYGAERAAFAQAKSKVTKRVLINGFGGAYVGVEQTKDGRVDVTCKEIPWDRLWYDPHSCEADFSDARYVGFDTWYDDDEAMRRFPAGGDALALTPTAQNEDFAGDTYDDKPRWRIWSDTKRNRVRVSEMYYRDDGVWHYACFTRGGELEPSIPVKYLDENGEPECPLQLVSAYIDRDNNRHGMVRDLVAVQDEINKRRQKALHLITMRQARVSRGASVDAKAVSRELAKPDGIITADKDEFEILQTNDMSAGNLALLDRAMADMQLMGPNAALQGKDPRSLSGRAIQAQQQGGLTELAPILDALRDWQLRVMRQFKNRIKQFWTGEMVVRVTDDERNVRFVGLNVPVTAAEALVEKLTKQTGAPPPPEVMQEIMQQPDAQMVVGTRNNISATDVDIIIDEQPDVVTLQAETFESLAKMVAAGLPIPPDVILESAPLPAKTKRSIQEKMEAAAQQPPKPDPAIEAKMAETQAKIQADQQKQAADMQLKQMEIEAQREQMMFEREKMGLEAQKAQDQRAFDQVKMQFELEKLSLQIDLARQNAAVSTQANMVRVHEINNPPPQGTA